MKNRYIDLIEQTFEFPQKEFEINDSSLLFNGIPLMNLIEEYGTPLRISYLPKIREKVQYAKQIFENAIKTNNYKGRYNYCYASKSSYYKHILETILKEGAHIEVSSAYDLSIIIELVKDGILPRDHTIICNGFKTDLYLDKISKLIDEGFYNLIPIVDNFKEIRQLKDRTSKTIKIGIRVASEEDPKFKFYTSRLGVRYNDIITLFTEQIANDEQIELFMLHFYVNTGIEDNSHYWNELHKCLKVYVQLKRMNSSLSALNIGGGFPIKTSLSFDYNYEYMASEIVKQIKQICQENIVREPNIYSEFGSFTVGESGVTLFKVINQKKQNDLERWNIIDGSLMTMLPDTWAINKRFILLPINKWDSPYERTFVGGITCDGDDYYNSEQNTNAIYLPKHDNNTLYLGFFNTGAYQDSIGGTGGVHHCLVPDPKYLILDRDKNENLIIKVFREQQEDTTMLKILGY